MKKRCNSIIAILYGIGVVAMIATVVIIRFRIDRIAEFTV
jgi:uncharacterized membrane protein